MFNKILIANRGEIAVRIIRACREMGIQTVAVYSEADKDCLHTLLADEAICIGPAVSGQSYLNMERILAATVAMKADAIHPGFGFLSENAKFAKLCAECNITFIGPSAEIISKMGNKSEARKTMMEAGVPVVPGSKEPVHTAQDGLEMAKTIGFPVMIKASSGGGGKGMRISRSAEDFTELFNAAQMESVKGFSDDTMYIEKYIEKPRHVEFQIMADKHGSVVHLGERDCSIQRRHQKVLEEAPCDVISPELRRRMGDTAVRAAKAVGYENAGTIEFLLDKDRNFYFMEMNTRIQVEHPVTEMVTGMDLIKEQIRVAAGELLSVSQKDVTITKIGHKDGETVTEERWEVQQAWDKQGNFLQAQARAQKTLEGLIKQYDELLHKNWELASEEQKARIAQLRAQTDKLTGNNQEMEDMEEIEEDIYGSSK